MERTKSMLHEVYEKLKVMEDQDPRKEIYLEQKDKLEAELNANARLAKEPENTCESCQ